MFLNSFIYTSSSLANVYFAAFAGIFITTSSCFREMIGIETSEKLDLAGVIAYRQSISVLTGQSNWTVCAIVRVAIGQLLFCVVYSRLAKNSRKLFLFSGNDYLVTEAWFRLILSEISALVIKQMGLPLGNHSQTCMTTDRT